MKIILNNKEEELLVDKEITINELLKYKNFTFKLLVVKVNGKVIKKSEYALVKIKDGDIIDVIHLISGG